MQRQLTTTAIFVFLLSAASLKAQWTYNSNGQITAWPYSGLSSIQLYAVNSGSAAGVVIDAASSATSVNYRRGGTDLWITGAGVYRQGSTDFSIGNNTAEKVTIQTGTGNVGVGTTVPNARLSEGGGTGLKYLLFDDPGVGIDYKRGLGVDLSFPNVSSSIDVAMGFGDGTDNSFNVVKPTTVWPYSAYTKLLTVLETGNVGIGTTVPNTLLTVGPAGGTGNKLTVNGDVTVTGNFAAKFQDIAEWVPVTEPMPAGTVVVVTGDALNTVSPSSSAYDTSVAGVISAQPGLTLGEASATKAKVATTGRVKVRVDASKNPVHAGDLLVTSDRPGTAMKSEPLDLGGVKIHRPGTLIGKALEPLAKGQGEILVLLSLQ